MYSLNSRVRYSETDSEKRLTLPSLLDYLQDCCTFQSEDLGIGIDYLAQIHAAWVLSSWQIKITRYPVMGERIRVSTWPYHFKGFYGYRNFTVENEEGDVLAQANSIWIFMDVERMRPVRIQKEVTDIYLKEIGEPLSGEWSDRKITVPDTGTAMEPVQVAKFHIDTNHHMNNGKYILVAEEYLPDGFEVGMLRAEYRKAAVLGDILYPFVATELDSVTVTLKDGEGNPYAVVCFFGAAATGKTNREA